MRVREARGRRSGPRKLMVIPPGRQTRRQRITPTRRLESPAEDDTEEMAADETAGSSRLFGAFAAASDGEG